MNGKSMHIKKAIIFLWVTMILLAQPAVAEDPFKVCRDENPDWYVCAGDSDCVITRNPCGGLDDAVNKKDAIAAKECSFDVGSALGCVSTQDETYHAICQNGECVAVPASKE